MSAPAVPDPSSIDQPPIRWRRVILESPYGGGDPADKVAYARACVADCLRRGDSPYASHLLLTQPGVLDNAVPAERDMGIEAGLAWSAGAEAVVVYEDLGVTEGMERGIARHVANGLPIERRRLAGWETKQVSLFPQPWGTVLDRLLAYDPDRLRSTTGLPLFGGSTMPYASDVPPPCGVGSV